MSEFDRRDFLTVSGAALAAGVIGAVVGYPKASRRLLDVAMGKHDDDNSPVSPIPEAAEPVVDGCIDVLNNMSIEAKIGALVVPMASIEELDALSATMDRNQVSNFALLGDLTDTVAFGGQQLLFADAMKTLKQGFTDKYKLPVTFALDEEGGSVQRTKTLDSGAHKFDSPKKLAKDKTPDQIRDIFQLHGTYLQSLGVTVAFGPLTDVGTHGADGSRSFSDDPGVVAASAGAAIEGLRLAGIQATAKHLPDNGRDPFNTDTEPGIVPDIAQLENGGSDANGPFEATIPSITQVLTQNKPAYGMVGNYVIPGKTDPSDIVNNRLAGHPASLNKAVYDYIRANMGFEGALMTDALNAVSIQKHYGGTMIEAQVKAAAEAINAGADMVIISLDATDAVVAGLKVAVSTGRTDEAAGRALAAKGASIC